MGHADDRGCPDTINFISKAILPVLVFLASVRALLSMTKLAHHI